MKKSKLEDLKKRSMDWRVFSTVSRTYPPSYSFNLRRTHGGIKPPELCLELIFAFGSKVKMILDPFAGVGSTLLAASIAGCSAVGIEINPKWYEMYQQVCYENHVKQQQWYNGDSKDILKQFSDEKFDFLLTDIPYFSMDKLKKTRGKFSKAGEATTKKLPTSLKQFNQEPIPSYDSWKTVIKDVFSQAYRVLKPASLLLVFIGNMYRNVESADKRSKIKKVGKYFMLSAEVSQILVNIGYQQLTELIWIDTGKKLGIYGYPFIWIPSLIDQRILVFKR